MMKVLLKQVRHAQGLTQEELARRTGMTLGNVQRIEYGKAKSIPLDTLESFCHELKCVPGDLLRYIPPEESEHTLTAGGTP